MQPDFVNVLNEVARRKTYEWPKTISFQSCPYPIALRFGKQAVHGYVPLYLANGAGSDLLDVTVSSRGLTCNYGGLATSLAIKELGPIPAGTGRLIEVYDVHFDGDFIVFYTIEARLRDGDHYRGRASTKGLPGNRWLRVEDSTFVSDNLGACCPPDPVSTS